MLPEKCRITKKAAGRISRELPPGIIREPISAGGRVYYHALNEDMQFAVMREDPETQSEDRVAAAGVLLDAHDEEALVLVETPTIPALRLVASVDRDLDTATPANFAALNNLPGLTWRLVDKGRVVWIAEGQLKYFDGETVHIRESGLSSFEQPYVAGNFIAWSSFGELGSDVVISGTTDNEAPAELRWPGRADQAFDHAPVIGSTELYFLADGQIRKRSLMGGTVAVVHHGPCGPPGIHGIRAVFSCGAEGAMNVGHRELFVYEHGALRSVPTNGGYVHIVRVVEDMLAWVEYPNEDAFCRGSHGSLFAARVPSEGEDWGPATRIAEIGAPCRCCDAASHGVELSFEGNLLAWNYDVVDGVPDTKPTSLGWAVLTVECDP